MKNRTMKIISDLGGHQRVAERLGVTRQTINNWIRQGFIPERRHIPLRDMAKEVGVSVRLEDFYSSDELANESSEALAAAEKAIDAIQSALAEVNRLRGLV